MLFSRDHKPDSTDPKKRSLFGQLFNPNVGTEIAPVFESGRMFVRMLAYILASYKLFPKDHPALENTALKLSLGDVMRTAYGRLSFTREGIPQIILFVAVFGCLLFSALFIVTLIFSALMGTAHAQTTFTSPHANTDWALKWIDYLFLGKNVTVTGSLSSQPEGCQIQKAMGTALSIYSSAVLVLAGFLLMYHLVFMIAEQAHTGKLMGKANQIWAPIRLVFAIGMLVPITAGSATTGNTPSCQVDGYNTAQYVAVQVARWGSGLGSRIWEEFVSKLASQQVAVCSGTTNPNSQNSPSCIKNPVNVYDIVKTMVTIDACAKIFNYHLNKGGFGTTTTNWFGGPQAGGAGVDVTGGYFVDRISSLNFSAGEKYLGLDTADTDKKNYNDFYLGDGGRICGGYVVSPKTNTVYDSVRQSQFDQLKAIQGRVVFFNNLYVNNSIEGHPAYASVSNETIAESLQTIADTLQSNIDLAVSQSLALADQTAKTKNTGSLSSPYFSESGWLMAGAWFSTVSKIQAARSDSVRKAVPIFVRPTIYRLSETGDTVWGGVSMRDIPHSVARDLAKFDESISYSADHDYIGTTATQPNARETAAERLSQMKNTTTNPVNSIMKELNQLLADYSIWSASGVFGIKFGATSNPMAELAAFGQSNVEIAMACFGAGIAGSIGGNLLGLLPVFGDALGKGIIVLSSLLTTIGALFFTIGFTLGYIVPLYPFYRFFFGSLSWAMTVLEAIVLAPLFALAHIEPQGEGLAGKRGQYGYSVAMQLLLRPVLMVFGLIAGYMLFKVAVMFLNEVFIYATAGTGAYSGSIPVIAKIIYTVIYAALVVIMANQCFSTIGLFPQLALRWLGLGGIHEEKTSDTGLLTAAAGAAASHISNKIPAIGQGIGGVVGAGVGAVTKRRDQYLSDDDKLQTAAIQRDRHDELIDTLKGEARPGVITQGGQDSNFKMGDAPTLSGVNEGASSSSGGGRRAESNYDASEPNLYGHTPGASVSEQTQPKRTTSEGTTSQPKGLNKPDTDVT